MRRLLYVPLVHSEADMGATGAALDQKSASLVGELRWALHRQTVGQFWDRIWDYLYSLDARQLKIYQDGLPAAGEVGRRIVEEAARRGSRNYQVILDLLHRGAELRGTEDPLLLSQEQEHLHALLQAGAAGQDAQRHRAHRDRLTQERDRRIAENINATLKDGELGALFLGAYHNVVPHLAQDLSLQFIKEPGQVMAYFEELFLGHNDQRLQELALHLTSPVGAA